LNMTTRREDVDSAKRTPEMGEANDDDKKR
jgi:hypothetical protein